MNVSEADFRQWKRIFSTELDCLNYLFNRTWPNGYVCFNCGNKTSKYVPNYFYDCIKCNHRASVLKNTIFQEFKKPLKIWFWALYLVIHNARYRDLFRIRRLLNTSFLKAFKVLYKTSKIIARYDENHMARIRDLIESNNHLQLKNYKTIQTKTCIDEPKVYLVSYPRSGNTFVRTFFYHLMGTDIYSVYNDFKPFRKTSLIPDWEKPAIIKDHTLKDNYRNVIYIIRDGRDATLSYAYFSFLNNKHDFTKVAQLPSFMRHLKNKKIHFGFWGDHVKNALNKLPYTNTLIVKYENLKKDPINQFKLLTDFLKMDIPVDRIEATLKKVEKDTRYTQWHGWGFNFKPEKDTIFYELSKKRGTSNWKTVFDKKAKEAFHHCGGTEMLIRFGYETDEDWWKNNKMFKKP